MPEKQFLQLCIRCGECFKVCPNNVLQPMSFDQGLDNLWTPQVVADWAGCESSCNNCGQVCPTGAIREISVAEKLGEDHRRATTVAGWMVEVSERTGDAEAAALPLTAITAWEMLFDRLRVTDPVPGAAPAVLIIGGAGGVGNTLIGLFDVLASARRLEPILDETPEVLIIGRQLQGEILVSPSLSGIRRLHRIAEVIIIPSTRRSLIVLTID